MAYPTIDAPYGLVPVGLIGGRPYTGATRQMKIASNYGTAIGKGDLVKRVNDGTIERDGSTSALPATGTLGVFMGCQYTDPNTSQLTFSNSYPASTVASDIHAYVADDPDLVMKVAICSSGTTKLRCFRSSNVCCFILSFKRKKCFLSGKSGDFFSITIFLMKEKNTSKKR